MNPFSSIRSSDSEDKYDTWDEFATEHLPDPGPFLEDHEVLEGDAHVDFHAITREVFESRHVYDATFGYNLAKLNLDRRHPDAGYRYAIDSADSSQVWAEFTPTTAFCPQATALLNGSFRAWNGEGDRDRHAYDLIRVRIRPTHHQADSINAELERAEQSFQKSGTIE